MKHTILRALCLLCALLLVGSLALTGCGEAEEPKKEDTQETPAEDKAPAAHNHDHNHEKAVALNTAYEKAADGTLTLNVKDCEGNLLFAKTGLKQRVISENVNENVVQLSWVLNANPGGYECVYLNRLTCQVSDVIAGEQATDGTRIVLSQVKDGKLQVIARDLFDKNGYSATTLVEDAYTGGAYTVLGMKLNPNGQVRVTYLANEKGEDKAVMVNMYEDKAAEPTKKTEKTEKK